MLIIIRLATGFAIFILLFCVVSFGALVAGGAIAGGRAGAKAGVAHEDARRAGREAGRKFGRDYGVVIFLGSFAVSGILGLAIPFTGLLPWCRKGET